MVVKSICWSSVGTVDKTRQFGVDKDSDPDKGKGKARKGI